MLKRSLTEPFVVPPIQMTEYAIDSMLCHKADLCHWHMWSLNEKSGNIGQYTGRELTSHVYGVDQ